MTSHGSTAYRSKLGENYNYNMDHNQQSDQLIIF